VALRGRSVGVVASVVAFSQTLEHLTRLATLPRHFRDSHQRFVVVLRARDLVTVMARGETRVGA